MAPANKSPVSRPRTPDTHSTFSGLLTADEDDEYELTPTNSPYLFRDRRSVNARARGRDLSPSTPTKDSEENLRRVVSLLDRMGFEGPLPFQRYNPDVCTTLYDVLNVQLPPSPLYLVKQSKFLSSTKGISIAESNITSEQQLSSIIYAQDMLSRLEQRAKVSLLGHKLDWSNTHTRDVVAAIHPYNTVGAGLTPVIHSEKDKEDWFLSTILRPALLAHLAYTLGPGEVIPRWNGQHSSPEKCGPYVSSSAGKDGVIPDALVMDGIIVQGVVEVKTDRVLFSKSNDSLLFRPLQTTHEVDGRQFEGRAIRFVWPTTGHDVQDKQSKILVQVWTQMVVKNCDFGVLSSYSYTIFLYRRDQTLYMSETYFAESNVLLAMYCWVSLLFRDFNADDLNLPECDTTWWNDLGDYETQANYLVGIIQCTLPSRPST